MPQPPSSPTLFAVGIDETHFENSTEAVAVAISSEWSNFRLPKALIATHESLGTAATTKTLYEAARNNLSGALTQLAHQLLPAEPSSASHIVCVHCTLSNATDAMFPETVRSIIAQLHAAARVIKELKARFGNAVKADVFFEQQSHVKPSDSTHFELELRRMLGPLATVVRNVYVVVEHPVVSLADILLLGWRRGASVGANLFPPPVRETLNTKTSEVPAEVIVRTLLGLCKPQMRSVHGEWNSAVERFIMSHQVPAEVVLELLNAVDANLVDTSDRSPNGLDTARTWCERLRQAYQATQTHPSWNDAAGYEARFRLIDVFLRVCSHRGEAHSAAAQKALRELEEFLRVNPPPDLTRLEMVLGSHARIIEHYRDRFEFDLGQRVSRRAITQQLPAIQMMVRQVGCRPRAIGSLLSASARLNMAAALLQPAETQRMLWDKAEALLDDAEEWFSSADDRWRLAVNRTHLALDRGQVAQACCVLLEAIEPTWTLGEPVADLLRRWLDPKTRRDFRALCQREFDLHILGRLLGARPLLMDQATPGALFDVTQIFGAAFLEAVGTYLEQTPNHRSAGHPWLDVCRFAVRVATHIQPTWRWLSEAKERAVNPNLKTSPILSIHAAAAKAEFGQSAEALQTLKCAVEQCPGAQRVFIDCLNPHTPLQERCDLLRRGCPES